MLSFSIFSSNYMLSYAIAICLIKSVKIFLLAALGYTFCWTNYNI